MSLQGDQEAVHQGRTEPDLRRRRARSLDGLEAGADRAFSDREALSLIAASVDIPANPAIAADVLAGEIHGYGARDAVRDKRS